MKTRKTSTFVSMMALLAALTMILSACVPAGVAPQPAASDGAAAPAATDGEKVITMWHIQTTEPGPQLIQQAVDRFMADNPGVKVEVEALQNDPFKTKIKVAMGAGNPPCIFPSWGGGPLYEYVKSGQVTDLTPYMDADNYKDRFVPASLSNVTFDDKIWGVPVENSAVAVLFYNKPLFEQYGLNAPATWDDLMVAIETFKANDIAPFALANKTKWTGSMYFMYLVDRLGGPEVFKKAGTRTGGTFEDPVFIEAGKRLQELVNAGAFSEGFNGLDYDTGQSRQLMYAGKAAMELMGSWNISTAKGENPEFYEKNLDFVAFPALPDGKGDPNNVVGTVGDNFYSISPTCAYPEEAFKLLQYIIDDESVKLRGEAGKIPPVKGFTTDDPMLQKVIGMIEAAPSVQLWYDQYLPPELGEVHKDTSQALFGLSMTPEEAAKAQEDAAKKFYGEQ
ncbi:MAG: extracellular solute-binding protein [Anaerolineales bacterium]|nr:extracellular solute-binding protein [Anaerolineales bacterium]